MGESGKVWDTCPRLSHAVLVTTGHRIITEKSENIKCSYAVYENWTVSLQTRERTDCRTARSQQYVDPEVVSRGYIYAE